MPLRNAVAVATTGCVLSTAAAATSVGLAVAAAAAPTPLVAVDVIYHAPLPVLSSANAAGQGKPPDGCIVFNPAYIPASPPQLNESGLLVRMCCGPSCVGHGAKKQPQQVVSGGVSAERIGFAPCDLETAVCGDVLADFSLDPDVDAEDPRAFVYDGAYYNFYYRGAVLPGTHCVGTSCTVALAKTKTPLDATSWQPVATLDWHRNGCCVMRPRGQRSYCMWGEGPGPFPGLGISYTEDIDSGNFTQVPWKVTDNATAPVTEDSLWMLPLGPSQQEIKLEAGTHMVELSSGHLFTFYAAATPGWVPNGSYTVGWLLLDGADPTRILQRSQEHVLVPTYEYETLCNGSTPCPYTGERRNVIFACSATLLPATYQPPTDDGVTPENKNRRHGAAAAHGDDDDNTVVDHIRLFFGGGDGNVGTAVIRVASPVPPSPSPSPPPAAAVPTVLLNDGRRMPRLAVSLPKDAAGAVQSVAAAFQTGVTHFVTAHDYLNQKEVGDALRASGRARDEYFLTTMTSPCQCDQAEPFCHRNITDLDACTATTRAEVLDDLAQLGMDFVDLVLLHGPNLPANNTGACTAEVCAFNRAQWRAFTALRAEGKVGSVGVSNYCPSCLDCLLSDTTASGGHDDDGATVVVPVVNQVQYHVGYGAANYSDFVKHFGDRNISIWAYEPLAHGTLASNPECAAVGARHNKSAAQAAMKWVEQQPGAVTAILTHSNSTKYLQQDVDVFSADWQLTAADVDALDQVNCTTYPAICHSRFARMTWGCTE